MKKIGWRSVLLVLFLCGAAATIIVFIAASVITYENDMASRTEQISDLLMSLHDLGIQTVYNAQITSPSVKIEIDMQNETAFLREMLLLNSTQINGTWYPPTVYVVKTTYRLSDTTFWAFNFDNTIGYYWRP
jgi:hypothetical protein